MSKLFCPKCKKEVVLLGGDVVDETVERLMQKIRDEGKIPMMEGHPAAGQEYIVHCQVCQTLVEHEAEFRCNTCKKDAVVFGSSRPPDIEFIKQIEAEGKICLSPGVDVYVPGGSPKCSVCKSHLEPLIKKGETMISFRDFIEKLRTEKKLVELKKPVSKDLELAGVLSALDGQPVYSEQIKENFDARIAGNVFSTKDLVAECLGCKKEELIAKLTHAINHPTKPELVENGPVLKVKETNIDLSKFPIPFHAEKDGGPYFSSAVVIAYDKELGRNCSFHRMMIIGKDRVVMRILPRHLEEFIKRNGGELDVAFVLGAPINVLLAGAISIELGKDELGIANTLMPVKTVRLDNGIEVPADVEFAFEGRITTEQADEGPFVDLTETYDIIRKQPVMKITKVYHRKNPIWHVLLPGGLEHKLLMGMPREPTIFNEVSKVCECVGVNITPGGCSWLHAVVAIRKKSEEDGKKAIEAAFKGHKSLKHVVIVDDDIDIYNPNSVEWAIATRVQANKSLVIKENERGSSLDPSADPHTYVTSKMGIDATKPLVAHGKNFEKASWMKINAREWL